MEVLHAQQLNIYVRLDFSIYVGIVTFVSVAMSLLLFFN